MPTHMGDYLRDIRRAKPWTQEQLARALKTGRTEISKFENQPGPPSPRMLARLVMALGADAEDAFERAGYGRQRAVLELDALQQPDPQPDALTVIGAALEDGGWARDIRKALLVLVRATQPQG